MRLWRITQRKDARDKLCAGAAQYGGRWNPIGAPALYCGTSVAICSLGKFVHRGTGVLRLLPLVAIDIPEGLGVFAPPPAPLSAGWDALPTSRAAQGFGGAWLAAGRTLGMLVPSVVVPEEMNMILNPAHPAYAQVDLSVVRPLDFDMRMFK